MKKFFKYNGLSLAFFLFFIISMIGQAVTGLHEYNEDMQKDGGRQVTFAKYLSTGHFIESTFENWESEFLQMGMFVILSVFLFQKGSSESKDPDKTEAVDREPNTRKRGAPWPVRRGGFILVMYKYSLSIAFILLFLVSFLLHWYGSLVDYNEEQALAGEPGSEAISYLSSNRFWFESFQNWQSEFLSVFAIIFLSIYLRHKGSPQSKPVDAPDSDTGAS
jgi:hypothetical protein